MSQGKFAKSEMFLTLVHGGEYVVTRVNENDTSSENLYQGGQENCERYAHMNGTEQEPLWVEHLESGYRKMIKPYDWTMYTILREDGTKVFRGNLEECEKALLGWLARAEASPCEVWADDWLLENELCEQLVLA